MNKIPAVVLSIAASALHLDAFAQAGGTARIVGPAPSSVALPAGMEANTNRPGSNYRSFDAANAQQCQSTCANEAQCRAWSWVKPAAAGAQGKCWLKNAVPAASASSCCVSGLGKAQPTAKAAISAFAPQAQPKNDARVAQSWSPGRKVRTLDLPKLGPGMDADTDRPGANTRAVSTDTAFACQDMCDSDASCKAWSFRKPVPGNSGASCWVKNAVTPPRPDACCISGLRTPVQAKRSITDAGAQIAINAGVLQPAVLRIDTSAPKDYTLVPGATFTIHGRGFGDGGQVLMSGNFHKVPRVTWVEWRADHVTAHLPDDISGEEDVDDVTLQVAPNGQPALTVRGLHFHAARDVQPLQMIPQHMVSFTITRTFGDYPQDVTPSYATDGQSAVCESTPASYSIVSAVLPSPSAMVARCRSQDQFTSGEFADGVDTFALDLKRGFEIDHVEFAHGRTETNPDSCTGIPGGQYLRGKYDYDFHSMAVRVWWAVWRCHNSPNILVSRPPDSNESVYAIKVHVKGPRGVSPWK